MTIAKKVPGGQMCVGRRVAVRTVDVDGDAICVDADEMQTSDLCAVEPYIGIISEPQFVVAHATLRYSTATDWLALWKDKLLTPLHAQDGGDLPTGATFPHKLAGIKQHQETLSGLRSRFAAEDDVELHGCLVEGSKHLHGSDTMAQVA